MLENLLFFQTKVYLKVGNKTGFEIPHNIHIDDTNDVTLTSSSPRFMNDSLGSSIKSNAPRDRTAIGWFLAPRW